MRKILAVVLAFCTVFSSVCTIALAKEQSLLAGTVSGNDAVGLEDIMTSEIVQRDEQTVGESETSPLEEFASISNLAGTEGMSTILEDVPEDILLKEQNVLAVASNGEQEVGFFSDDLFGYTVIAEGEVSVSPIFRASQDEVTDVEIPQIVTYADKNYKVTQIEWAAFRDYRYLTSVVLPNSIKDIGGYAFENCIGLTSIDISDSLEDIGTGAFSGCINLVSICNMPERMQSIGYDAFCNCSSLKSIKIPYGVTNIETRTFYGCSSLSSIDIPDGVTDIGSSAFQNCSSLTNVTIPDSVISIWGQAFQGCSSLVDMVIPDSVAKIMINAFQGCDSLVIVDIPKGILNLGSCAFDCDLELVRFKGDAPTHYDEVMRFGGRELTVYYPINNATWTEHVKVYDFSGDIITWIPWNPETGEVFAPDGTEPGEGENSDENVPSDATFYLSSGIKSYAYKEDMSIWLMGAFKAVQKGNVNEEADAIVWESSDPLVADINHVSYIPETNPIYGDDNVNTLAHIDLYLDCYKPGIVTITGTSADGRTTSETIMVEPELIVKEEISIKNDTEITVCSFSIEEPNADFLESVVSGLTIKCKSQVSPFVEQRFEVAENGRTVSVIWEIIPEFDGNFIYEVTSLAGQKKEIKMDVDIDGYNLGDVWSIDNYIVSPLPLTEPYRTKLMAGMGVREKAYMEFMLSNNFNGQCYGMAVTSLLIYKNVMQLDEIDENVSRLYDAHSNSQTRSIIGYYHLNQLTDAIIQHMKQFRKLSTKEQLDKINNSELPFMLSFGYDGWGTHVVVGYEIEHGVFRAGTEVYDTMLKFYDSNQITTNGLGSYSALYFNEGTDQWTIPRYVTDTISISSAGGGYLKDLCADTNILSDMSSSAFKWHSMMLRNMSGTSEITLYTEDQTYVISGGNFFIDGEIMTFYDDADLSGDQVTSALNILLEKQTNCTIVPSAESSLDWGVLYEDFFMNATADSYDSISFDNEGAIAATGLDGSYTMNLTMEESPFSWYTLEFNGSDAGQFSVELVGNGVQISGNNLNDITVYGTNDVETKELTFSTDEYMVLLSEEDGELVIVQTSDEENKGNGNGTENNNGTNTNNNANTNSNTQNNDSNNDDDSDENANGGDSANNGSNSIQSTSRQAGKDSVPRTGDELPIAVPATATVIFAVLSCILGGQELLGKRAKRMRNR